MGGSMRKGYEMKKRNVGTGDMKDVIGERLKG